MLGRPARWSAGNGTAAGRPMGVHKQDAWESQALWMLHTSMSARGTPPAPRKVASAAQQQHPCSPSLPANAALVSSLGFVTSSIINPADLYHSKPSHLHVHEGQGDGDAGAPLQNLVDAAVVCRHVARGHARL